MYEATGQYYALFGPQAGVSDAERAFLAHLAAGRQRALDFGAGLCAPAMALAAIGLEVLAFEPSPTLVPLALDRLGRADDAIARRITLVGGAVEDLNEPFDADLLLMRSVWMLLDDRQRGAALAALLRHAAPDAMLIVDARTAALSWADAPEAYDERVIGATRYRRSTRYERRAGGTHVHWTIEIERFGKTVGRCEEAFFVRADTLSGLAEALRCGGFAIERSFGGYDLDSALTEDVRNARRRRAPIVGCASLDFARA